MTLALAGGVGFNQLKTAPRAIAHAVAAEGVTSEPTMTLALTGGVGFDQHKTQPRAVAHAIAAPRPR